jgi:hypothetical protein
MMKLTHPLAAARRNLLRAAALVLCAALVLPNAAHAAEDPVPADPAIAPAPARATDGIIHYLDGDSSTFIAGGAAQFIDADPNGDGMGLAVIGAEPSAGFAGGYLLIIQTGGLPDGSLALFTPTVTAGGDAAISAGETIATANHQWQAVGSVAAGADGQEGRPLRIDLNAGASALLVEDILLSLLYSAPTPGARQFTLLLDDGGQHYGTLGPVTLVMTGE